MPGMRDIDLFQQALGLAAPWHVAGPGVAVGRGREPTFLAN